MKFMVKSWTLGPATSSFFLSLIFNVFGLVILYHYFTSFYRSDWELFGAAVMFAVGIPGALCFLGILHERKVAKKEFFPLNDGVGESHVLHLANKLQDRLSSLNFLVETNEDGIRISRLLSTEEEAKLTSGKPLYNDGIVLLKTIQNHKFIRLNFEMALTKENDIYHQKTRLVGGRSIHLSYRAEMNSKNGMMHVQKSQSRPNSLGDILKISQKEDHWKEAFDAESKYALQMGALGGGGAILVLLGFFIEWLVGKF